MDTFVEAAIMYFAIISKFSALVLKNYHRGDNNIPFKINMCNRGCKNKYLYLNEYSVFNKLLEKTCEVVVEIQICVTYF